MASGGASAALFSIDAHAVERASPQQRVNRRDPGE
jgi:hypothetical protein